jgi:hypothetical protein
MIVLVRQLAIVLGWAFLLTSIPILPRVWGLADQSVQQMIARADAARVDDQPELYINVAERQLKTADQLYKQDQASQAQPLLGDIELYSGKAQHAALASGKRLKNTEIALRKMAARLRDIQKGLNFEDQAPVKSVADHLDGLRDALLNRMFSKESK